MLTFRKALNPGTVTVGPHTLEITPGRSVLLMFSCPPPRVGRSLGLYVVIAGDAGGVAVRVCTENKSRIVFDEICLEIGLLPGLVPVLSDIGPQSVCSEKLTSVLAKCSTNCARPHSS